MFLSIGFVLFLLYSTNHRVSGLVVRGNINTNADWIFLAKFCFVSRESQFIFSLESPDSYANQNLVLYYDYQWSQVYPRSLMVRIINLYMRILVFFIRHELIFSHLKPCQSKLDILDPAQVLAIDPVASFLNCNYDQANKVISCNDERGFITSRPRWWFVVLARCNSTVNI